MLWELALLGLIIYVPILQAPFGTFPLPLVDWLILVGAALTIVPVLETMKWMERRAESNKSLDHWSKQHVRSLVETDILAMDADGDSNGMCGV